MRFTSSSVTLTLEVSSIPCLITPSHRHRQSPERQHHWIGSRQTCSPHRLQAAGVDEVGDVDLTDNLRSAIALELHRDLAIFTHRNALGVFRDLDFRLQRVAITRGHYGPFIVEGELTVTGIGRTAIRQLNFKVATTTDHQIERVVSGLYVTLTVVFLGRHHLGTRPQHQAGGELGIGRRAATGLVDVLIQQIFKDGP